MLAQVFQAETSDVVSVLSRIVTYAQALLLVGLFVLEVTSGSCRTFLLIISFWGSHDVIFLLVPVASRGNRYTLVSVTCSAVISDTEMTKCPVVAEVGRPSHRAGYE